MGRDSIDILRKHKEIREKQGKAISEHIQPVIQSTSTPKLPLKIRLMSTVILPIVRHLLTTLGGAAGLNGLATDNDYSLIAGAIMTIGTIGWSIYSKKKAQTK